MTFPWKHIAGKNLEDFLHVYKSITKSSFDFNEKLKARSTKYDRKAIEEVESFLPTGSDRIETLSYQYQHFKLHFHMTENASLLALSQ